MRIRVTRALAPLVAAGLVLTSCGGNAPRKPTGTAAPGVTGEQLGRQLTRAGIPVVDDPVAPATKFEFLRRQADAMALEASAHGGYTGAQLDAIAPGTGGLGASYLLAAYVKNGDTLGARWAQERIGAVNWAQPQRIVFPTAVLALFVGDVLQQATPGGPGKARTTLGPGGYFAAGGVCTDLTKWVTSVLDALFNALKVDASAGGFGGLLASIWNTAVDLAGSAVKAALGEAVKTLTKPIIDAVSGILAVLGTVSMASSLLKPWLISVTAKPGTVKYGVKAPGEEGAFTTKAVGPPDPWPADIRDCAQLAGITLPDPSDVSGSKVKWTINGLPPFGEQLAHTDVLEKDGTATFGFRAGTEDSTKGPLVTDTAAATVEVARADVEKLRTFLTNLVMSWLSGALGATITSIINALTQPVIDELISMISPGGTGWVAIEHHGPEEECKPPAPGRIPEGKWSGPITLDVTGQATALSGSVLTNGTGQAELTVVGDGVTGTWGWNASGTGTLSNGEVTGTLNAGTFTIPSGTIAGKPTGPAVSGQAYIRGTVTTTVMGQTFEIPIDDSFSATATMTITDVTCETVTATFIPSFNAQTAGRASFSGVATWTAHKDA